MPSRPQKHVLVAGMAAATMALPAFFPAALAQGSCTRYEAFEGQWDGSISVENVERRYPQTMLSVPEAFNPDHRALNIVYRGDYYEVSWNLVEGQNVPSLRERAQIADDADGYCARVRRQSNLAANIPGLRINIDGSYRNGAVNVVFHTRTCCFLYQADKMACAGATHYRTQAYQEERPWYDGLWYVTMTRAPRPNDCQPDASDSSSAPLSRDPPNFDPDTP